MMVASSRRSASRNDAFAEARKIVGKNRVSSDGEATDFCFCLFSPSS
jgi:hypothetical protein